MPRSSTLHPSSPRAARAIAAMGVRLPYWYEPGGALDLDTLADAHAELALRMLGAPSRKR